MIVWPRMITGMTRRTTPRRIGDLRTAALFALICLACAPPAAAQPAAGEGLTFLVSLSRDSILVGDPVELRIEASGPEGARLVLPEAADSVGPLAVLSAGAVSGTTRGGRTTLQRRDNVTAFRTGTLTLPSLPMLWIRGDGDTLAAWSRPVDLRVGSLVQEGATLEDLRDLRGVVRLSGPAWLRWAIIAVAAAVLAWVLMRHRPRFGRKALPALLRPPDPPLPPEIAFERGYRVLLARRLAEAGRFKEFYGEMSLLLRAYIEGRFLIPAVEETRTELLEQAGSIQALDDAKLRDLRDWLEEGDLVKFAKLDRLPDQAQEYGERARVWVIRTTPQAVEAEPAARPGTAEVGTAGDSAQPAGGTAAMSGEEGR